MAEKFHALSEYEQPLRAGYQLLPFRFSELRAGKYVLSNMAGEYIVVDRPTLESLVRHTLPYDTRVYADLKARHFLEDGDSTVGRDLLALKTRTKFQHLAAFTSLHIFVVSLRCEHSCPYCQVSRQSDDRLTFDMSVETADRALDLVFESPSRTLKIEFQGGESLLNFELIRHLTLSAKQRAAVAERKIEFVIATNLALVNDEILDFCREQGILISTSLDGPEDLHNANRPRPGRDSYRRTIEGIQRVRRVLGDDRVSALMTTTKASLTRARDIIDEYRAQKFDNVFLRALSPYGFAVKTKTFDAYDLDSWLAFYKDGLEYIIQLNRRGERFVEQYAAIILTKMLTPFNPGYVDLISPAGIGTKVLVYNYDGDVYASDEARMLAEMGDKSFRLGNVHRNTYQEIIFSDALLEPIEESFPGSAPMCSDCAFEPFCGAEPVFHHATHGDNVGRKPTSLFCSRNMEIFRYLIERMESDPDVERIFRSWVAH